MSNDYLQKINADFERDRSAGSSQRDMANEELRFTLIAGGQWEDYLDGKYDNRAKMELDVCSKYLWRNYATWCNDRYGVSYSPDDGDTDDSQAELLEGLYRRDVKRRGGQDSIDTAVLEAMACGVGAVVLRTEFDNDEDPDDLRQNIVVAEQANSYSTVFFDSSATRADKSDARHCTVLVPYAKDRFEEVWPDKTPTSVGINDRSVFQWQSTDTIYVAERYHTEVKSVEVYTYYHPVNNDRVRLEGKKEVELEQAELLQSGYTFTHKRTIKKREVFKTVFSGNEILEEKRRIAGKHIPVIPFYGYRGFVDGLEWYHGLARKNMDVQRMYNMVVSLTAEAAATSHPPKHIFAPEQMNNPSVQNQWSGDMSQKSYLLAEPIYDENGNIIHAGPLGTIEGGSLTQGASAMMQFADSFLRQQTGGMPQDTIDPNASGKAINAMIKRSDQDTRPIFDNFAKSIRRIGEVYRSMAGEIYAGSENKSRLMRIVTKRDDTKAVKLMTPQAGPNGVMIANDVSKGRFEVIVDVTKDYATQKEETFEQLKDVLSATSENNPIHGMVLSRMIQLMPGGGMSDIKEYLRNQELLNGTAKPETDEEIQWLQSVANQPKSPDANAEYLMSEAEKNKANTALTLQKMRESAAKTQRDIAEAKQTNVETALMAQNRQLN